jgi:hypothetical protein
MALTLNGKICVTSGGFFRDAQYEANSRGNSWNVSGRRSLSLTAVGNNGPGEKPEISGRFAPTRGASRVTSGLDFEGLLTYIIVPDWGLDALGHERRTNQKTASKPA